MIKRKSTNNDQQKINEMYIYIKFNIYIFTTVTIAIYHKPYHADKSSDCKPYTYKAVTKYT